MFHLDILLHQSGHIMLTDFDLSKGSSPPGKPGVVKSTSPNLVSANDDGLLPLTNLAFTTCSLLLLIQSVVSTIYGRTALWVPRVCIAGS